MREIVDDKYNDGSIIIGGTTGAWSFTTYTSRILDREFSYVTPENDFKQWNIHPDNSNVYDWSDTDAWADHIKKKKQIYRILTRRHFCSQRIHINKIVAFVNTPVQPLPVIAPQERPIFPLPSSDILMNELSIGWSVFGGKRLGEVGLKTEWLREHVAVLGATGTGKTTLVKKLISELTVKTDVPWWIFDVKGSEYSDLAHLGDIHIIRPGLDPTFVISLIDSENSSLVNQAHSTFSILRELLRENNASDLSPAMEKLLRELGSMR